MSGMSLNPWVLIFRVICWTATITVISYWLYVFSLNEDLSSVHYKKYYQSKGDVFPVLSLCFRNPFSTKNSEITGAGINESSYLNFLEGTYFVPEMLNINYENITIDVSEYVVKYWVEWRNGSYKTYSLMNDKTNFFTSSYAGFWRQWFYNCYAMQVPPDKLIQAFSVLFENNAFPSRNRSINRDRLTLLHYPNQLTRSLETIKYFWPKRQTNVDYDMKFKINGMEVMRLRSRGEEHCNVDWENDDDSVIVKHTNAVGCRAPYQNPSNNIVKCSNKDQMKEARFTIGTNEYGTLPPCKTMEKIYYTYEEADLSGTEWSGTGRFWFTIYIYDQQFKEIVQTR